MITYYIQMTSLVQKYIILRPFYFSYYYVYTFMCINLFIHMYI